MATRQMETVDLKWKAASWCLLLVMQSPSSLMPPTARRQHGDPFPLPERVYGGGLPRVSGLSIGPPRLRDPRLKEAIRSLNFLESGGSRGFGSNSASSVAALSGAQRSIIARTLWRLDLFGPDEQTCTDRVCLEQLLKNRDFYGLEQFNLRRPFDRSRVKILHSCFKPRDLDHRLRGRAAALHADFQNSIERTAQEVEYLSEVNSATVIRPYWDPILRGQRTT